MNIEQQKKKAYKEVFQLFTVIDFKTPLSRNALCRSALQQICNRFILVVRHRNQASINLQLRNI